ncbi:hypothetical protein [Streptomyces sp. NBC_00568]|uniref:hypothetical protein n=1 Tax=Streptomyces sp. NBC_00568 TaxID=2975779 RepID=UPI00338E7BB5
MLRLLNGQQRTQTYTWNSRNRLTGTTTRDGESWTYLYDSVGRRVAKQRLHGRELHRRGPGARRSTA